MTAKELRRQHQVDKQRKRRQFIGRLHLSTKRIPQAINEEQEEEQTNPGVFLRNLGAAIAAFLQTRRDNFKR